MPAASRATRGPRDSVGRYCGGLGACWTAHPPENLTDAESGRVALPARERMGMREREADEGVGGERVGKIESGDELATRTEMRLTPQIRELVERWLGTGSTGDGHVAGGEVAMSPPFSYPIEGVEEVSGVGCFVGRGDEDECGSVSPSESASQRWVWEEGGLAEGVGDGGGGKEILQDDDDGDSEWGSSEDGFSAFSSGVSR